MKVKRCGRCDNALSEYWQNELCLHCLWQIAEVCAGDERTNNERLRARLAEAEARVRELEGKITAYIHANTQAGLKRTEETGEAAFQAFCGLLDAVRIGKPSGEGGEDENMVV